ncbi:MAG: hypothetical protein KBC96_08825 [Armatimonadetes bacterium]|nr:hypothetical protein [Armatimonadota bacterium]
MNTWTLVIGINAVVWTLLIIGWRFQRARIEEKLRQDVSATGEYLVLGPQNGYYAKSKGVMAVKSMGVMALTNKRLIFRVLFGMGFDIPLEDIVDISGSTWFQGMYRNGQEFMILRLRDESEIGFQTRDHQAWAERIRSLAEA